MSRYDARPSKRASISRYWGLTLTQRGPSGKAGQRRWSWKVLTALALSCGACGQSTPAVLIAFQTEAQAQAHCPKDTVVWVEPQSGMYYVKGHASYGHSIAGRYACRGEADAAGMHGVPN
jgi:hypothetical protein